MNTITRIKIGIIAVLIFILGSFAILLYFIHKDSKDIPKVETLSDFTLPTNYIADEENAYRVLDYTHEQFLKNTPEEYPAEYNYLNILNDEGHSVENYFFEDTIDNEKYAHFFTEYQELLENLDFVPIKSMQFPQYESESALDTFWGYSNYEMTSFIEKTSLLKLAQIRFNYFEGNQKEAFSEAINWWRFFNNVLSSNLPLDAYKDFSYLRLTSMQLIYEILMTNTELTKEDHQTILSEISKQRAQLKTQLDTSLRTSYQAIISKVHNTTPYESIIQYNWADNWKGLPGLLAHLYPNEKLYHPELTKQILNNSYINIKKRFENNCTSLSRLQYDFLPEDFHKEFEKYWELTGDSALALIFTKNIHGNNLILNDAGSTSTKDAQMYHCLNEAEMGLLALTIALQSYYDDEGNYPEELTLLVPKYLKNIPLDPLSGKPFIYNKEKTFLYGVGYDQEDNNGDLKKDQTNIFDPINYRKLRNVPNSLPKSSHTTKDVSPMTTAKDISLPVRRQ